MLRAQGCSTQTDNEQSTLWNGIAGRAWVETQDLLDRVLKPFEDLLVEAAFAGSRCRVLDVGCGTGATTLTVARLLGLGRVLHETNEPTRTRVIETVRVAFATLVVPGGVRVNTGWSL